jgi:murein DD-endopeptidase
MLKQFMVLVGLIVAVSACKPDPKTLPLEEVIKPVYEYGYNINNFNVIKDTIRSNETFGSIMNRYGVDMNTIHVINELAIKESIDLTKIKLGYPYTLLTSQDTSVTVKAFVYEVDKIEYWKIDLTDSIPAVQKVKKQVKTKRVFASGVITSSLFETLESQGVDPVLAINLSEVYAYSIDFYRIQENDRFKVIYDQQYVDDTIPYKVGKIYASYFEHKKDPYYAFGYATDTIKGFWQYYDEEARELKKMFLKSPIDFGRISSKYSMSRYVKIYGRHKPHLGTDFAAPVGTPIKSTANGVVIESAYRGGNGNFVKVKHNETYTTQYLHMSKRAVTKGQRVSQGQIIGYIGMTGSTTGPHVCYRFWKNGKQVDALKEKITKSDPLPEKYKPAYMNHIKPLKAELDSLAFPAVKKLVN